MVEGYMSYAPTLTIAETISYDYLNAIRVGVDFPVLAPTFLACIDWLSPSDDTLLTHHPCACGLGVVREVVGHLVQDPRRLGPSAAIPRRRYTQTYTAQRRGFRE